MIFYVRSKVFKSKINKLTVWRSHSGKPSFCSESRNEVLGTPGENAGLHFWRGSTAALIVLFEARALTHAQQVWTAGPGTLWPRAPLCKSISGIGRAFKRKYKRVKIKRWYSKKNSSTGFLGLEESCNCFWKDSTNLGSQLAEKDD